MHIERVYYLLLEYISLVYVYTIVLLYLFSSVSKLEILTNKLSKKAHISDLAMMTGEYLK